MRELENAIEHAAVLSRDGRLTPELLPPGIVHGTVTTRAKGSSLAEVALDHIQDVLRQTGGNRRTRRRHLGHQHRDPVAQAQRGTTAPRKLHGRQERIMSSSFFS